MICPWLARIVRPLGIPLIALAATVARAGEVRGGEEGRSSRIPWTRLEDQRARPSPRRRTRSSRRSLGSSSSSPSCWCRPKGPAASSSASSTGASLRSRTIPGVRKTDLAIDLAKLHPDLTAFYGLDLSSEVRRESLCLCLLRPARTTCPTARSSSRFDGEPDGSAGDRSRRASRCSCGSGRAAITAAAWTSARTDICISRPATAPVRRPPTR